MTNETDYGEETDVIDKISIARPKLYKVLLHNDDYTTMDFVIYVLKRYFHKTDQESHKIMLNIHNLGRDICGVYTFEIAETKKEKVMKEAKEKNFPLLCTIEKE